MDEPENEANVVAVTMGYKKNRFSRSTSSFFKAACMVWKHGIDALVGSVAEEVMVTVGAVLSMVRVIFPDVACSITCLVGLAGQYVISSFCR